MRADIMATVGGYNKMIRTWKGILTECKRTLNQTQGYLERCDEESQPDRYERLESVAAALEACIDALEELE